jgi:DNA (cytosine-5)-methyltransferase 1
MKYLSLFSGIGGFELGMPTDFECVGYSEIDKYAIQIYEKHFNHNNFGDITKIKAEDLPEFDLIVGGFPCQSFSIAGKRGGFNDTRGTLIYDVLRIAKAKEPMYLLLENVKGLVSHDGGKTLETILESLQELGYYVNMEIRNSKDYGVPQNRERIFILCKHIKLLSSVGQSEKMTTSEQIIEEWLFQVLLNNLKEAQKLQGTESKDWVLGYLICQEIKQNLSLLGENILDGILMDTEGGLFQSTANPWQNIDIWLQQNLGENLKEVNKSTISTAIKQITESETYTFSQMFQTTLLATVLLRQSSSHLWNEVLSSLIVVKEDTKYARINNKNEEAIITENGVAHLSEELQDPARYFTLSHLRGTRRPQVFPIGETADGVSEQVGVVRSEIRTSRKGGNKSDYNKSLLQTIINRPLRIRRLTPTECERLQGFPDGWTEFGNGCGDCGNQHGKSVPNDTYKISDTQRYKCLGNAVTVNVIREIITRLEL